MPSIKLVPKNSANNTPKHTNRNTKRKSSRTPNIMRKASESQVKRAISRYKKRQNNTQIMDHAVPEDVLFTGVLGTYQTEGRPEISTKTDAEHSPFILALKPLPTPAQLLEQSSAPQINLMYGRSTLTKEAAFTPDLSQDLNLTQTELQQQLTQNVLTHHGWSTLSLPATLPTDTHHLEIHRLAQDNIQHTALRKTTTETRFSAESFAPQNLPENIFDYFVFPEEDEREHEDEQDIVTLEEIQAPKQKQKRTWNWPTLPAFSNLFRQTLFAHSWQRAIASFVALSFVFVLPLHAMNVVQDLRQTKTQVETQGTQAVSLLSAGAQAALARDSAGASQNFTQASAEFESARQSLKNLGLTTELLIATLPITGRDYKSGQALITAGEKLSIAGERIAQGYAAMENELQPTPISRLNILSMYIDAALPHLIQAADAFEDVDETAVPQEHQATLSATKQTLPALIQSIEEFQSFYELARVILGGEGTKRYLIVFQNNTEIRPTGGFIGSFAEVKIHDGMIEQLHVPGGGSYDLQGQLQQKLIAPEPLRLLRARWEFQDANWFADFPTSSRQLLQFYQDAGGPSVDGVLSVNATFIAKLIGLLGPIEMEEYNRTINEENFMFETQKIVEVEYDKEENTPKAFIGDLAPLLVDRAIEKTSEDFLDVVDYLNAGLSQKELQIYLSDQELQREIINHGWGGEVKWTEKDYLMVSNTNLGGGKTDGVIQETVDLQVNIQDDGSVINTVTIDRTHYGIPGLMFTGVNNVNYTRVYVPKGSELIEATGFNPPDSSLFEEPEEDWKLDDDLAFIELSEETDFTSGTRITEESGKTVFGNWVQTKPGTTSTVSITYKLPFTLQSLDEDEKTFIQTLKQFAGIPEVDEYALTIQKQPGVLDRTTKVTLTSPTTLEILWSSHEPETATFTNQTDAHFATLFESL